MKIIQNLKSRVPLEYFGVPGPTLGILGPGSHLDILGSPVPDHGIPPVDILGLGSLFSGMLVKVDLHSANVSRVTAIQDL